METVRVHYELSLSSPGFWRCLWGFVCPWSALLFASWLNAKPKPSQKTFDAGMVRPVFEGVFRVTVQAIRFEGRCHAMQVLVQPGAADAGGETLQ